MSSMSHLNSKKSGIDTHRTDIPVRRVILRLRVNEFDGNGRGWEDHIDAIQAYFKWVGLQDEHATNGYFAHVEPFQGTELQQKTFHVVLDIQPDIQQQMLDHVNFDSIPHEVYRVRRKFDGEL